MCNETEEATKLNASMYGRIREDQNTPGGACYAVNLFDSTFRRLPCSSNAYYLCEMPNSTCKLLKLLPCLMSSTNVKFVLAQTTAESCLRHAGNDLTTFQENCPISFGKFSLF